MSQSLCNSLWKKVESQPNGCMVWLGCTHREKAGYGRINVNGKSSYVHRLVPKLVGVNFEKSLTVTHKCDNPTCVNPLHLKPATQQENLRDMNQKGRHWLAGKTHCKRGHEYAGENLYTYKDGRRDCKACMRLRYQRSK